VQNYVCGWILDALADTNLLDVVHRLIPDEIDIASFEELLTLGIESRRLVTNNIMYKI